MARRETYLPAPVGWNTRDPLSGMPAQDASVFTNLITDETGTHLRSGYSYFLGAIGGAVDFLKTFHTPWGQRLYSCNGGILLDITYGNSVNTRILKSGLSRSSWSSAVMNGFMGMVNGSDTPIKVSYGPASGSYYLPMAITGVSNPERFKVIHVFKSHSFFATGDEPAFYHSAVNALGGTVTRFPLDRVSGTGGNVIDFKSWTVDGGNGPDDYLVIFLNSGEVLVYQGSDPANANDWAIVGRYSVGKIITAEQFAGQIHAVTSYDYNVFPRDFQSQGLAPPSKLVGAAKDAVTNKGGLPRWQILFVPHLGWRIINVPQAEGTYHQHVLNLNNGTAALFTGLDATRWEVFNGQLLFGTMLGAVMQYGGSTDNGTAISWEFATAPQRLAGGSKFNVLEYRTVVSGDGSLTESTGLGYDYQVPEFIQDSTTDALGTSWNTSPWDTSSWSQQPQTRSEWLTGVGSGQAVQLFSRGSVQGFIPTWRTIDFAYEPADIH